MLNRLLVYLRLIQKLGFENVAYVIWYRISLRIGYRKWKCVTDSAILGRFFHDSKVLNNYPDEWSTALMHRVKNLQTAQLDWFHYHIFRAGNPLKWFRNPFDRTTFNRSNHHWTQLGDFDLNTGDIKIIWEPSRFEWVTDFARAYRVFGYAQYLETLNFWLNDWSVNNPLNIGPNWKCGQETSIRIFKLFTASAILNQETQIESTLNEFIFQHITRVRSNIRYAIAQDNNHGTSEAAGIYVGSLWLLQQSNNDADKIAKLKKWRKLGRNILEERILSLIGEDGTFSQKSVTYQRVVIDTISVVLHAQELFDEPPFAHNILKRLEKLGEWQVKMTITENGDAPNIGSNDGAMFENLHECDYRDFRPSSQQFFGLLLKKKVYPDGKWNEPLFWRTINSSKDISFHKLTLPQYEMLDQQFLIAKKGDISCYLTIPDDRFRPGMDVFHLDLWYRGENILLDSGSYSYNAGSETDYYKSIKAHNTVQFGGKEPMPKITRFLNGEWIKAENIEGPLEVDDCIQWSGTYTDYRKNQHKRTLRVSEESIQIVDEVISNEEAVLHLHLPIGLVKVDNKTTNEEIYSFESGRVKISGSKFTELSEASNSLYYMQKQQHTLLRSVFSGTKIITDISFNG